MADPDNSALENTRKRARRRLVGAVVLALAAAVVLPMFLESDPKPLGPDVQIQIPAIDDARFQNRLTPPGKVAGAGPDQAGQPPAEAQKSAAIEAGKAAAPPAAAADLAANRPEPALPAPAEASRPGESKPLVAAASAPAAKVADAKAPAPSTAKPAETGPAAAPVATAAAPQSAQAAKKSGPPADPSAATTSSAAAPAAAPAPPKKSAAAAPTESATAQPPAPAAALPAFSLTATVPPVGAAPAAAPNPGPASAPPAAPGQFVVQLGAFIDSSVARDLAGKAGAQGFSAYLETVTTKSGKVQRVRVGPFATRAEADAAAARLKGAGFTTDVRSR